MRKQDHLATFVDDGGGDHGVGEGDGSMADVEDGARDGLITLMQCRS
jgi:hypothetical protein